MGQVGYGWLLLTGSAEEMAFGVRGNDNYMEEESGGDEVEPLSLDDAAYSCDRIDVAVD